MSKPAIRHLSAVDPVMRALIRRVGPCRLAVRSHSPFETLVRATPNHMTTSEQLGRAIVEEREVHALGERSDVQRAVTGKGWPDAALDVAASVPHTTRNSAR